MKKLIILTIFLLSFQIIYSPIRKIANLSYKDYASIYAMKYNLDPALVKAIISFESDWNPKLRNKKSSAYGLPQFIKSTGKWVARELGYKEYNHFKTEPKQQIEMMCWYLNYLHKKYDGNTNKALREYNGNELKERYNYEIKRRL